MISLVTTCLLFGLLAGQVPEKERCTVYLYLDDQGHSVRTRKLGSVPADKRNSVITYRDCSFKPSGKQSFSYVQESEEPAEGPAAATFQESSNSDSILDWIRRRHRAMERWQVIVVLIGLAFFLGGLIGIAVAAFRVGIPWGLGVLFLPIVPLVFVILYWQDSKVSFLAWLAGWLAVGLFGYVV